MTTATETRWDNYAPTNPSLKHEHKPEFINTAPTGTVIEVWEDLYKRLPNGNWMHLEELEYTGYSYSEHREHAQSTPRTNGKQYQQ